MQGAGHAYQEVPHPSAAYTYTLRALDPETQGHTPCTLTEDTCPETFKTLLGAPHTLT